jgi:hypothetical protein
MGRRAEQVSTPSSACCEPIFWLNSGLQGNNTEQLTKLHGPVLLINGHERDFLMASSKATYDKLETLPAFYGARHGAGHTATVDHPG